MGNSGRVFGLVLAAGTSSRLGCPKQLLELDGKPLVVHVVSHVLEAQLDGVVVVTGSHASEVELELLEFPVFQVFNPQFAEGQGTSLAAGVRALPSYVEAVVIVLADMPGIRSADINGVVERWRVDQAPAVVTRYASRVGHPVLFARETFAALGNMSGGEGGRQVLQSLGDRVAEVRSDLAEPPLDVDTEDDWVRLQRMWGLQ